ncbi:Type IV secretory pathway, VirB10 component [Paraburkholderia ribeironis]|uniref:Type IV secretory pathway, VirB10 component n=1 Tax=Paraburkholderia ribeironis TaxID=1247936 RepID=A0A1N7RIF1_9BURK|nr:TrbI/VirB10 family protein [Paraburkholderia ribeironis]SIT34865.1 Type IV secretory pathway, VirB10 component [Paraburkholderia ribeironis]
MNQQNGQQNGQSGVQTALFKGKSPRNALIAAGLITALVIGSLGFYYQVKENAKADEEAALKKKAKSAEVVDKSNSTQDLDKTIEDQLSAAHKLAASEARAAAAARASAQSPQSSDSAQGSRAGAPSLTADGFLNDQHTQSIKAQSDEDAIYASPIFKAGLKVKDSVPQQLNQMPGILTPAQVAAQQAAAQQAAAGSAGDRVAAALSAAGVGQQAGSRPYSTQDHDSAFMKNVSAQSENGQDFARTGFVGQARGCVLSPPHHIGVLATEKLNSDRPGAAALVVEKDVYDSIRGDCLMIPKGSLITAPYSSDIQPGQESILVAATELRLPNGKHVPLYGAQGADGDGAAGFSGDVNNHFLKIFGTSFLTAILLGAFDKGGTSSTTTGPLGVTQVGTTAGQVAAQTSQSVLERYKNIPPTITDDPGKRRFMLKVNRDIVLEPYHDE